ncbi:MAG: tetratricopeptide repeat protein, partial [Bacteroidota bacterium]
MGKTIANVSILIHAEGRFKLAEQFIEETITYFKEVIGENTIGLASLYANHATISQAQGRYSEAEEYFDLAESIIKKNDRIGSLSHAIVLNNKALLYNEIGQYNEALETMSLASNYAAGSLRGKGRDNVSFKINKGLIHYSAGDYGVAERTFKEIIELKKKRFAKNQTDVANVKNYLAATLMATGKTSGVPELIGDALNIFEKKYSRDHPAYIKTKYNKGKYNLFIGNYSEANRLIGSVNETYKRLYGENHPDYLSSLEDMAVTAWKEGNISLAKSRFEKALSANLELVEKYFGAMSEYEKGQYWAKVRPSILKFYAFAVEYGTSDPSLLTDMYNMHLKTKGILLSASTKVRQEILNSKDEKLRSTYKDWVDAKENLLLYYSYSKAQLSEFKIDLANEEEKANQLEKELNRLSSAFAQSNQLPQTTLAEVKSKLKSSDAAVEIIGYPVYEKSFTSKKKYAFLIVDRNGADPELVLIENGQDLDAKYAKAYLNMVKLKTQDRITYDKFWRSVDEALVGKDNIYLSLDGVYFQVNIGALQRSDGSYVSDNKSIHLYSSTRDLVKPSNSGFASKKATFFGYPDFGT